MEASLLPPAPPVPPPSLRAKLQGAVRARAREFFLEEEDEDEEEEVMGSMKTGRLALS